MAVEEEVVTDKSLDAQMDDTIRATLKDISSRDEETGLEPESPDRPRDGEGKFTKADKAKESAAPEKADTPSPVVAPASDQVAAETPTEPLQAPGAAPAIDINRAPSSWKPAAKAAWNALPEPVRAEIYRREGDFHNGNKGIRENADFGQSVKSTLEPYRMLIEAEGGTPERAIADTMKTAALFRVGTPDQKLNAIFEIDQKFCAGALNQHFLRRVQEEVAKATGQPGATQPNFQDPRVDQILAGMQQQERERAAHAREQAAHSERISNSAVETFINAKDDKGQALYPFVDNVLDDMSTRVAALRRMNPALDHNEALKSAYDAAVWANPETRQVLLSQQQAQANLPQETLRKVESAKRASGVNVPRRGAIPAKAPDAVLRLGTPESDESIRETLRQLTG